MQVREYHFLRCLDCRTLFMAEEPGTERFSSLYADDTYFTNPDFDSPQSGGYHGYLDYLADRSHIEEKFSAVLAGMERHVERGRLLDIGAGPGLLLSVAGRRGWTATGLEINPWAARYGREQVNVDVREVAFEDADFQAESFDAVTMMDFVEHIPDPDSSVQRVAGVLRPGGVLAILTPDAGSLVSRMLRGRWPELRRAPEHLVLFSTEGLGLLLERHGFEVLDWDSIGKRSSVATLLADVSPAFPRLVEGLRKLVARTRLGDRTLEINPRTKFCLYARKA